MSKNFENNDKYFDDLLAEFADQVVDGQSPQVIDSSQETTFRDLQEVILAIHDSVSVEIPDVQTADRIKHNLLEEWKSGFGKEGQVVKRESWLDKMFPRKRTGWQSTSRRNRNLAVQVAVAAVIVLALIIPLLSTPETTPGTAFGTSSLNAAFILLVILSAAYFLWYRRKK